LCFLLEAFGQSVASASSGFLSVAQMDTSESHLPTPEGPACPGRARCRRSRRTDRRNDPFWVVHLYRMLTLCLDIRVTSPVWARTGRSAVGRDDNPAARVGCANGRVDDAVVVGFPTISQIPLFLTSKGTRFTHMNMTAWSLHMRIIKYV
jgi:hypothetical protein